MGRLGLVAAVWIGLSPLGCGRAGLAAPSASSGGQAGAVGDGGSPEAPLSPAPAAGDWRLYGFEDPVVVHLEVGQDGRAYDVTGRGCDVDQGALLDPAADVDGYCGPLQGQGVGLALQFAFDFPKGLGGPGHYKAAVHASKDGTRLAGTLSTAFGDALGGTGGPFGWIRYEPKQGATPSMPAPYPGADLGPFTYDTWHQLFGGTRGFALKADAPVGGVQPGTIYWETAGCSGICSLTGELGVFWNPDFHWDEATRSLTAGPVPETIPGAPVKLQIHFDADDLGVHDVVVTTADGATGSLLPFSN